MIIYNIRNRGPLEYDKFMLNLLQFKNQINIKKEELIKQETEETNKDSLLYKYNSFNNIYELFINENSKSNKVYEKLIEKRCL